MNNKFKKICAIALCTVSMMSLAACGKESADPAAGNPFNDTIQMQEQADKKVVHNKAPSGKDVAVSDKWADGEFGIAGIAYKIGDPIAKFEDHGWAITTDQGKDIRDTVVPAGEKRYAYLTNANMVTENGPFDMEIEAVNLGDTEKPLYECTLCSIRFVGVQLASDKILDNCPNINLTGGLKLLSDFSDFKSDEGAVVEGTADEMAFTRNLFRNPVSESSSMYYEIFVEPENNKIVGFKFYQNNLVK